MPEDRVLEVFYRCEKCTHQWSEPGDARPTACMCGGKAVMHAVKTIASEADAELHRLSKVPIDAIIARTTPGPVEALPAQGEDHELPTSVWALSRRIAHFRGSDEQAVANAAFFAWCLNHRDAMAALSPQVPTVAG